jgi:hypothetical protein
LAVALEASEPCVFAMLAILHSGRHGWVIGKVSQGRGAIS